MLPTEIIKKKRNGGSLSLEEIAFFINGYTTGHLPDYQMSSLLMAIFFNGMSEEETLSLTQVMLDSGEKLKFESFFAVDKHSTGGVGDKTSLILAPIVAACGVAVPMMSGRGLGHTGGTLDKLESIPGFNVFLDLPSFRKQVEHLQLCFIGQTEAICPADKKIYALRDVTATVESLPLICASIMSKKIAEGISGLVLDVKTGSGAFMKTLEDSKALANGLISIAKGHGLKAEALITDMSQPLGRFVGNSLEVGECLSILKRETFMGHNHTDFNDCEQLSVELASHMIAMAKNISTEEAKELANQALDSGKAYDVFERVCKEQGGDLEALSFSQNKVEIVAEQSGTLQSMDCEKIGIAAIEVGAGRRVVTDNIQPETGIEIHFKIGDSINKGDPLFTIYTDSAGTGKERASEYLKNCFQTSSKPTQPSPLIIEKLS